MAPHRRHRHAAAAAAAAALLPPPTRAESSQPRSQAVWRGGRRWFEVRGEGRRETARLRSPAQRLLDSVGYDVAVGTTTTGDVAVAGAPGDISHLHHGVVEAALQRAPGKVYVFRHVSAYQPQVPGGGTPYTHGETATLDGTGTFNFRSVTVRSGGKLTEDFVGQVATQDADWERGEQTRARCPKIKANAINEFTGFKVCIYDGSAPRLSLAAAAAQPVNHSVAEQGEACGGGGQRGEDGTVVECGLSGLGGETYGDPELPTDGLTYGAGGGSGHPYKFGSGGAGGWGGGVVDIRARRFYNHGTIESAAIRPDDAFFIGHSVATEGGYVAFGTDQLTADNEQSRTGVYIYRYNASGAWDFLQFIPPPGGGTGAPPTVRFGHFVRWANGTLLVSSIGDDTYPGVVWVYRPALMTDLGAVPADPEWGLAEWVAGSPPLPGDGFGSATALSVAEDGEMLFVLSSSRTVHIVWVLLEGRGLRGVVFAGGGRFRFALRVAVAGGELSQGPLPLTGTAAVSPTACAMACNDSVLAGEEVVCTIEPAGGAGEESAAPHFTLTIVNTDEGADNPPADEHARFRAFRAAAAIAHSGVYHVRPGVFEFRPPPPLHFGKQSRGGGGGLFHTPNPVFVEVLPPPVSPPASGLFCAQPPSTVCTVCGRCESATAPNRTSACGVTLRGATWSRSGGPPAAGNLTAEFTSAGGAAGCDHAFLWGGIGRVRLWYQPCVTGALTIRVFHGTEERAPMPHCSGIPHVAATLATLRAEFYARNDPGVFPHSYTSVVADPRESSPHRFPRARRAGKGPCAPRLAAG
eukprot:gene9162-42821_t